MSDYKIPSGKSLRVAISGRSGCGNTTVSTLLSQLLGVKLINFTFRNLAQELGLFLRSLLPGAKLVLVPGQGF